MPGQTNVAKYGLCMVALFLIVGTYLSVLNENRDSSTNEDILNYEPERYEKTQESKDDRRATKDGISKGKSGEISHDYLIPPDTQLTGLSDLELLRIYWRYANTLQILCRNQTRLGSFKDGGKEVCIDNDFIPKKPCIVYSFGSYLQFDFENGVIRAFKCDIHTFDPTVKLTAEKKKSIPKGVNYHLKGLAGRDFVNKKKWQMATLETIVNELKHVNMAIDLLKIDIEGWEFAALDQALNAGSLKWVKQLLIEIHFYKYAHSNNYKFMLTVLRGLYDQGFRIFMRDRNPVVISPLNWNYTTEYTPLVELAFININFRY